MQKMLEETRRILDSGSYSLQGKEIALTHSREEQARAQLINEPDARSFFDAPAKKTVFVYGVHQAMYLTDQHPFDAVRPNPLWKSKLEEDLPWLILNFASPRPPFEMSSAPLSREEDLCLRSTLLSSLSSPDGKAYFQALSQSDPLRRTDAMLLSPCVEVFRDGKGDLLEKPFTVAVLTCAAPVLRSHAEPEERQAIQDCFYRRLRAVLCYASAQGYRCMLIGAWGCGNREGHDAGDFARMLERVMGEIMGNARFQSMWISVPKRGTVRHGVKDYNYFCFDEMLKRKYARQRGKELLDVSRERNEKLLHLDRIRGCLVGGAAGDALGYSVEFLSRDQILRRYGERGIRTYEKTDGLARISDDTQMTMYTACGLLFGDTRAAFHGVSPSPENCVYRAYLDWLETQRHDYDPQTLGKVSWLNDLPEMYARRAPGNTCLNALESGRQGKTDAPLNSSKGCGGVMRAAPVGLFFPRSSEKNIAKISAECAAITHGHPLGYLPAAALALIVRRAVFTKESLPEILNHTLETMSDVFSDKAELPALLALLRKAMDLAENFVPDAVNIRSLGQGWTGEECLAIAVYCALRYPYNFDEALCAAVNHDGDSDSTGSVTGNILGAYLGYWSINEKWKQDLELLDVLLELSEDLCTGCLMEELGAYRDERWVTKYAERKAPVDLRSDQKE